MKASSLNLLQYPRRQWRLDAKQMSGGMAALAAGVLLGSAWGFWSQQQLAALVAQRQLLEQGLASDAKRAADMALQRRQMRDEAHALERQKDWAARRDVLSRWHEVLSRASVELGLRVQLWQGDGRRVQLHAWVPEPQAWLQLQSRLTSQGSPGWTLQSLTAGPGSGVKLVLEAPVPAGPSAAGPSAEGRTP